MRANGVWVANLPVPTRRPDLLSIARGGVGAETEPFHVDVVTVRLRRTAAGQAAVAAQVAIATAPLAAELSTIRFELATALARAEVGDQLARVDVTRARARANSEPFSRFALPMLSPRGKRVRSFSESDVDDAPPRRLWRFPTPPQDHLRAVQHSRVPQMERGPEGPASPETGCTHYVQRAKPAVLRRVRLLRGAPVRMRV